jgi:hypothetical protein
LKKREGLKGEEVGEKDRKLIKLSASQAGSRSRGPIGGLAFNGMSELAAATRHYTDIVVVEGNEFSSAQPRDV